jgi:hypothetical protein
MTSGKRNISVEIQELRATLSRAIGGLGHRP